MKRDLSLGLILLSSFGLVSIKATRGQAVHHDRDNNGSCTFAMADPKMTMEELIQRCDYYKYAPDFVASGNVTVAVHRPPLQTWQPATDVNFTNETYFLVKKEKDCATAFSLADKGNGAPAKYICENEKNYKVYAELQCDGNTQLQNCSGLKYVNDRPTRAVLHIKASLH